MYDKRLYRLGPLRTGCKICSKEIEWGYELAKTKVEAQILTRQEGFICGECIAKFISDLKFTLERR